MNLFNYHGKINQFERLNQALQGLKMSKKDLIFTSKRIKNNYNCIEGYQILCHDNFGQGEPSDEKINLIRKELNHFSFDRIIAIGGGSVMDIAKILILKGHEDTQLYFEKKVPLIKEKNLVCIPTTCGTGSEVTQITIAYIKDLKTKLGLSHPSLLPDEAILVPELLKNIPFTIYMHSGIDALIHSIEAYLSPKATTYTDLLATKGIKMILKTFNGLHSNDKSPAYYQPKDMLIASNLSGLAFGNAGVGAIHALSYPLGGRYHVPHGESNYLFLDAILNIYLKKKPAGKISSLLEIFSESLKVSKDTAVKSLKNLLEELLPVKPLSSYGMVNDDIEIFSQLVINTQQRLLVNNYVKISQNEIKEIYKKLL